MFTGIVQDCGQIEKVERENNNITLVIHSNFTDLELGESIAVDGICLTVSHLANGDFTCELSPETVELTTASYYERGTRVNLERPMRLTDRFGGHFVLGHIDCQYQVEKLVSQAGFLEVTFGKDNFKQKYLIPKGSVAVNGVSLTINSITERGFSVMLIPHTLQKTSLSYLAVGSHVNIEYDYLTKVVINHLVNAYEKHRSGKH